MYDYDKIINYSSDGQEIERLKKIIIEKDKEIEKIRIMPFLDDHDDCSKQEKEKEIEIERLKKHCLSLQSLFDKTVNLHSEKDEKIKNLEAQLNDYIQRLEDVNIHLVSSNNKMNAIIKT